MAVGGGKVGRNITVTHCRGRRYDYSAEDFVDFTLDIYGNLSKPRATWYARRYYSDSKCLVTDVEYETHYWSMPLCKFVDNSERTN